MSPPAGPPPTKPCVRCRVTINAASAYCTLCGAGQPARRSAVRRLAALVAVLTLTAGAVGTTILLARSGDGHRAPLRAFATGALTTLVPSGWTGGPVAAPPGVSRAVFTDPRQRRSRLALTVARRSPPALRRARLARAGARALGGYRERSFGRILLSGARATWLFTYDAGGSAHAVYLYSACASSLAVTLVLSAPTRPVLQRLRSQIPASARPRCPAGTVPAGTGRASRRPGSRRPARAGPAGRP